MRRTTRWQGFTPEQTGKDDEFVTTSNNRAYTWKFANGKLSGVNITPDWTTIYKTYSEEGIARHPEIVPAFQDEADFLTQTYGKPSKALMVPYENGFGAQWERSELVWYAPDGTQIVAFERTGFNQQWQLELVSFRSKESLNQTPESKPNPYKCRESLLQITIKTVSATGFRAFTKISRTNIWVRISQDSNCSVDNTSNVDDECRKYILKA